MQLSIVNYTTFGRADKIGAAGSAKSYCAMAALMVYCNWSDRMTSAAGSPRIRWNAILAGAGDHLRVVRQSARTQRRPMGGVAAGTFF